VLQYSFPINNSMERARKKLELFDLISSRLVTEAGIEFKGMAGARVA
jgi:hypothetical protein